MSGLMGSKPKMPEPTPTVDNVSAQAASDSTRRRERAAAGRASTMLTGGAGVTNSTASIGTKKLLG